jgi:hypothetical protein
MKTVDPYAGLETEEERAQKYAQLNWEYEKTRHEWEKRVYDEGMKRWEASRKVQLEQDASFDKNLIALAAGSFGVSFAFIDRVVPLKEAVQTWVLGLSWALFGLTLVIALLGFRLSSRLHKSEAADEAENVKRTYAGEPNIERDHRHGYKVLPFFNWISFLTFVGGVTCLVSFVFLNV